MLQRIQSLYLFLTALLAGGFVFVFDSWTSIIEQTFQIGSFVDFVNYFVKNIGVGFLLVVLLALLSLFDFKNRKRQINLNRFNILINLILFGFLIFYLLKISGETLVSEKGIERFLPLVLIAFLLLANRAIQKDEDLVKSVDRLR